MMKRDESEKIELGSFAERKAIKSHQSTGIEAKASRKL